MKELRWLALILLCAGYRLPARALRPCDGAAPDGKIVEAGLFHDSLETKFREPFGAVKAGSGPILLRFRTCQNDVEAVRVRIARAGASDSQWDLAPETRETDPALGPVQYWRVALPVPTKPALIHYTFEAQDGESFARRGDGTISVYDPDFHVPAWLQGAVIYQIFPDRFRNGDPTNDPPGGSGWIYGQKIRKLEWREPLCDPRGPECPGEFSNQFYGGDLAGIREKLDYLAGLGASVIYLNPIFRAASNHRYDTQDYFSIDPMLGDEAQFRALARDASARGIRILLDGVFNHTSSDSPYFDYYGRWEALGACESRHSPYRAWFYFPDVGHPGGHCPGPAGAGPSDPEVTYDSFAGYGAMPRLRTRASEVQDFFYARGRHAVAPFWIGLGASGWRLDVGNEVDPGLGNDPTHPYWRGMKAAIRETDPESVLVGEEWGDASPWLLGGQWDSAMNYRFRSALLDWMFDRCSGPGCHDGRFEDSSGPIEKIDEVALDRRLRRIQEGYPEESWRAMMNLLGSHDTNRLLFLLRKISGDSPEEAKRKQRLLALFAYTYPGAPTVYYGDEVAVDTAGAWDGSRWQGDPYSRAVYPWAEEGYSPDEEMRGYYAELAGARAGSQALRTGGYERLVADAKHHVLAFRRFTPTEEVVVAINRDRTTHRVRLFTPRGSYAFVLPALSGAMKRARFDP